MSLPLDWTIEKLDLLHLLWTTDNDLSEREIGKQIGCSYTCAKRKAYRLGWKRHANYLRRLRERKNAVMRSGAWQEMCRQNAARRAAERRKATDWPPHRFEDDPAEANRPFEPDQKYRARPIAQRTYGGVASGLAVA